MHFRQDATLRGLALRPDDDPVEFPVPSEQSVVTLRGVTDEELDTAAAKGRRLDEDARAFAQIDLEPPTDYREAFVAISKRRLPAISSRDLLGTRWVDEDGTLIGREIIHMDHLPSDLQTFLDDIHGALRRSIRTACTAVTWRMAVAGHHDPVRFSHAYWSLDGEEWAMWPTGATFATLSESASYRLNDERRTDIQALIDDGLREPLAHALWREASAQRASNPRSALLIGIAALEVGVKQFASRQVPEADWLLRETQSPPIVKMLSRFLPNLQPLKGGQRFKRPDSRTLKILQEGVEMRNDVAHKGVENLGRARVDEILATVRDLLWRLDIATGLRWAEQHISIPDGDD